MSRASSVKKKYYVVITPAFLDKSIAKGSAASQNPGKLR